MRILYQFKADKEFSLPVPYNEKLQGFIYSNMEQKMAEFLHNEGYKAGKRKYSLFTFSHILEAKFNKEQHVFNIPNEFSFIVSSPKEEILNAITQGFTQNDAIAFNGANVKLLSCSYHITFSTFNKRKNVIMMLTPVTSRSTLKNEFGKNKSYYYHPIEDDFSKQIKDNLTRKYKAAFGKPSGDFKFKINPVLVNKGNEHIIIYKDFVVKGYTGMYEIITNNEEIMKLAYDTGLGEKNSQGFGMFEIVG